MYLKPVEGGFTAASACVRALRCARLAVKLPRPDRRQIWLFVSPVSRFTVNKSA
jgi:hypothetical protein